MSKRRPADSDNDQDLEKLSRVGCLHDHDSEERSEDNMEDFRKPADDVNAQLELERLRDAREKKREKEAENKKGKRALFFKNALHLLNN